MRTYREAIKTEIINYIDKYYFANGKSPSIREIADGVDIAKSTVYDYIVKMTEEGIITNSKNKGICTPTINKTNCTMCSVAIVGSITCGPLSFAEENITEYIKLPASLFGKGEIFGLYANGDSMINAGIEDGDLVFIRKQNTAEEGQIIVALVNDETTLKRFYKDTKNKKFILHPENEKYEDIIVNDLIIQGIVTKVLKDAV